MEIPINQNNFVSNCEVTIDLQPDEMTKDLEARKVISYPPTYLKSKALKYIQEKEGTTMSSFIADLMRNFFADPKNKLAQ